jgi:predicted DNA-binding protein
MSKGGRRPGAGRKPAPVNEKRVTMSVRITPEAKERLGVIATREGKSASRLLEDMIAEVWKNLEDGEN